jgi:hypothetical protein
MIAWPVGLSSRQRDFPGWSRPAIVFVSKSTVGSLKNVRPWPQLTPLFGEADAEMASAVRARHIPLSAKGLEHVASINPNDFTIAIGSTEFACTRFQAAFISPTIASVIATDSTISRYSIGDTSIENASSRALLQSLIRHGFVCLKESEIELMELLCESLGNPELSAQVSDFSLSRKDLTLSNCLTRLRSKAELNIDCSSEIHFLASHFDELDPAILESLEFHELQEILSQESLIINTEDSLVEYLISRGPGFHKLLGHVRFEHLTVDSIDHFLKHVSNTEFDTSIWSRICYRLRQQVVLDPKDVPRTRSGKDWSSRSFRENDGSPWSGIIAFLTGRCRGNVHTKDVVNITSSGSSSSGRCHQVDDHGWDSWWGSRLAPNSWLLSISKTQWFR